MSVVGTLKGMPEIGTFPIDVFPTTFAVPSRSNATESVFVTAEKNAAKAPSLRDFSG